jgi:hypothetical protein
VRVVRFSRARLVRKSAEDVHAHLPANYPARLLGADRLAVELPTTLNANRGQERGARGVPPVLGELKIEISLQKLRVPRERFPDEGLTVGGRRAQARTDRHN